MLYSTLNFLFVTVLWNCLEDCTVKMASNTKYTGKWITIDSGVCRFKTAWDKDKPIRWTVFLWKHAHWWKQTPTVRHIGRVSTEKRFILSGIETLHMTYDTLSIAGCSNLFNRCMIPITPLQYVLHIIEPFSSNRLITTFYWVDYTTQRLRWVHWFKSFVWSQSTHSRKASY